MHNIYKFKVANVTKNTKKLHPNANISHNTPINKYKVINSSVRHKYERNTHYSGGKYLRGRIEPSMISTVHTAFAEHIT